MISIILGTICLIGAVIMTIVFFYLWFLILMVYTIGSNLESLILLGSLLMAIVLYVIGWAFIPLAVVVI